MTHSSICTRSIAAAFALSFAASSFAQTTATTVPVGFITKTVPAAIDASNPSNTTIAVPLYATADFTSSVASVDSATQLTLTSAAWTSGQFVSTPHILRVKVGANVGRQFVISGNTANQLTVILPASVSSLVGTIGTGDSCEIIPANTLGSVFGTAASPPALAAGATASSADNVLIWNGTTWQTFFWTGTVGTPNNIWKRTGTTDQSSVIIYPDEAVFVIRRSTVGPASITLMGTVPSTIEKSDILSNGSTFLSNRFPVDATLGGLGLQNIPGWVAGASASSADTVLIWNGTTWQTFFWTGTVGSPTNIWKRTGTTDQSGVAVPPGTGVFVTHNGALLTLTQSLPYTP